MKVEEVLAKSQMFAGLSLEDIYDVARISREQAHRQGETIFQESEEAHNLYILVQGKVSLEMCIPQPAARGPMQSCEIRVVAPGASFGWSAVVDPYVYTLSARCVEACRSVAIDGARLRDLMESNHHIGYRVLKRLSATVSSRLKDTRQTLASERGLAFL